MIKKLINKLLGGGKASAASRFGQREDVPFKVHKIDRSLVDDRALDVVETLQDAGFEAYIVGGAVRDLLCGVKPKDFDVATDATPEQVKRLFRRAFIIGRRFRIVHVIYGRGRANEVIEVSTFRAYLDSADAKQVSGNEKTSKQQLANSSHAVDASGRVLRDNVWGPMEEDAARRDFSINAMYYDPTTQVVVDYHNGIRDAKKRIMRMIGEPAARYREDPVRVIRAVRFMAKLSHLGFTMERATREPLVASARLLADVPQSRLFDEMLKLLQTGHALAKRFNPSIWRQEFTRCWTWPSRVPRTPLSTKRSATPTAVSTRVSPLRLVFCWRVCCGQTCAPVGPSGWHDKKDHVPVVFRLCKRRWMRSLNRALVMYRDVANWVRT